MADWTAESLKNAVLRGIVTLQDNKEGKADCWKTFKLAVDKIGELIFGWVVCARCSCCILYKVKDADDNVKKYGTRNMLDHLEICKSGTTAGKQTCMTSFLKRKPGIKLSDTERRSIKDAEVRMVVHCGTSFNILDNEAFRSYSQKMIEIGSKHGNMNIDDVLFGRQAIRRYAMSQVSDCQNEIKRQVKIAARYDAVSTAQILLRMM